MHDQAKLLSKVLVLDGCAQCIDRIKVFCDEQNLVCLKAHEGHALSVLKSNVDLGAIFLSENYAGDARGGIALAREIHTIRPELPIFLRRDGLACLADLSGRDGRLFSAIYVIDDIDGLDGLIDEYIFSLIYPNDLIRGITALTKDALASQLMDMDVMIEAPYIVRDRIIFGEIFTMIPIESSWCRGHMMLQTEEESLRRLIRNEKTYMSADSADNFRNVNSMLGEITNLVWGAFKNRYASHVGSDARVIQVPVVINHLHRYSSFGSEDPQLCFQYTLTDKNDSAARPLIIHQRFVFNMQWSPDAFSENQALIDNMVSTGELELF